MTTTITLIKPDMIITSDECDHVPDFEELQLYVGGYIELIPNFRKYKGNNCVAFCNEEGKLEGLPKNSIATELWHQQLSPNYPDFLVGNIVIISGDEEFLRGKS